MLLLLTSSTLSESCQKAGEHIALKPLLDASKATRRSRGGGVCHKRLRTPCGWTMQNGPECLRCIAKLPLTSVRAMQCSMYQMDHFCVSKQHGPTASSQQCDILCHGSALLRPLLLRSHNVAPAVTAAAASLFRHGFGEEQKRPVCVLLH